MKLLEMTAPEVYAEFMQGNFVVKRTKRRFNQVPANQATEWINKTCKMQNEIIGITRNGQTRDKFCVTWAERSRISQDTRYLFNLEEGSLENLCHSLQSNRVYQTQCTEDCQSRQKASVAITQCCHRGWNS